MTTLFFLLTIMFFFYELSILTRTQENMDLVQKLKHKDFWKKSENTPDDPFQREMEDREKNVERTRGCFFVSVNMIYMLWVILGVALAQQWQIFLLVFCNSLVYGTLSKIFKEDTYAQVYMKKLDAVIGLILLGWIFMNHFHPGFFPTHLI